MGPRDDSILPSDLIHWPLRNSLDPLEEEEFLERYRDEFEEAGVIEPKDRRRPPRLR